MELMDASWCAGSATESKVEAGIAHPAAAPIMVTVTMVVMTVPVIRAVDMRCGAPAIDGMPIAVTDDNLLTKHGPAAVAASM